MTARTWIRKLFAHTHRPVRKAPARFRPALETLEDRLAPAAFVVMDTADSGSGSLRAAIDAANAAGGSNTITFAPAVAGQTITASANDTTHPFAFGPTAFVIDPGDNLTIAGDPTQAGIALSGGGSHRLFAVYGGASLTVENLTLTGGKAQGGAGGTVTGNGAGEGGGGGAGLGGAIFNEGSLYLIATTFTGNTAAGGNGGAGGGRGFAGGAGGGSAGFSGGDFVGGGNAGGGGAGIGGAGSTNIGATGGMGGANEFGIQAPAATPGTAGGGGGGGSGSRAASGTDLSSGGFGGGGGGGSAGVGGSGGFGGGGGGVSGGPGGSGGFGGGGGGGGGGEGGGGFGGGGGGGEGGARGGGGGAGMGGAIFNMFGSATLTNCTLTADTALGGNATASDTTGGGGSGFGGAVFNLDGKLNLTFCTLAENTVAAGTGAPGGQAMGGAIYNLAFDTGGTQSAIATITNSILSNTTGGVDLVNNGVGNDTSTAIVLLNGPNLVMSSAGPITGAATVTADPQLEALANNGGPTQTMAITTSSPAFNAGAPVPGITTDQRGEPRPDTPALGAFQPPAPPAPPPPETDLSLTKEANPTAAILGTPVTYTLIVHNNGPDATTGAEATDVLPAGLTFVNATPSQGSFDAGSGRWTIGTLANGATATLQITGLVAKVGPITNTAAVASAEFDPDVTNNISSVTIEGLPALQTSTGLLQIVIVPAGAFAAEFVTAVVTSPGATVNGGTMTFDLDGTVLNVPVQSGRATALMILPLPLVAMPQEMSLSFTPANPDFASSSSSQSARLTLGNALNAGWVLLHADDSQTVFALINGMLVGLLFNAQGQLTGFSLDLLTFNANGQFTGLDFNILPDLGALLPFTIGIVL